MSVLTSGFGSSEQAQYQISRSLRFNSADSAYLSRMPASAGNRKTWTWAVWVKRSETGTASKYIFATLNTSGNDGAYLYFYNNNLLYWDRRSSVDGLILMTNGVFRDPSAWYHIVLAVDYANATSTNRAKLYVNGVEQTYSTANYPNTAEDSYVNAAVTHYIAPATAYFDGYLADIHFIDGQALTPSSFGEFDSVTGVWKPKKYTGTYGTNGFYLNFSDNSATTATTLGKDSSGNNNNWTPNNFSVTAGAGNDSMVDTPTPYGTDTGVGGQVRGNYAMLNPLDTVGGSFANGNLDVGVSSAAGRYIRGTITPDSGKWYFEGTILSTTGVPSIGLSSLTDLPSGGGPTVGATYSTNGIILKEWTSQGTFATLSANDVVGVAYDVGAGTVAFYKNNSLQTTVTLTTGKRYAPLFMSYSAATASSAIAYNFGQRPFAYTAPSGFKALCTTNLPEPTIKKGSEQFNVVTYTGNGGTNSVTGVGFSPGLTWIKSRSGVTDHALYDTVRGATKQLESNTITAETTESTGLTSFGTDGFTLGSLAQLNTNTATYVGWNWKGGSTAVTNTQGTITSQVSANPTAGFSVVSFSLLVNGSQTVGHGLNIAPSMYVTKGLTSSGIQAKSWLLYHKSLGATKFVALNENWSESTNSTVWDNIEPTSAVFRIGSGYTQANYGTSHIAYCFSEIPGYSAFGSYTGNGSADGPFVYLGFRPRFILLKVTNTTGNWTILDTAREGYNVDNDPLYPNLNNAEGTTDLLDILSNGFKLRTTDASVNGNTNTYIYAAFAENSSKYALAR